MDYQSEAELEKQLLEQLVGLGYKQIIANDESQLEKNFRTQLYLHNQAKMKSKPFSDKEFERIKIFLDGKSVFQSAKLLRDKMPLIRDDGTEVNIEYFDSKQWCKNIFQVTHQTTIEGSYANRYDVTILINGFPIVQIELKRRGIPMDEAINQIERYRKHSFQGLYKFIQVFVVSNGVNTKYFANSDKAFLKSMTFFWTDDKNKRISNLNDFTCTFLEKCFVSKIVARYMVINESDKVLMVMRPYQIYAVKALVDRALNSHNNGYVWHTTGSGKTLTSFKASQIIADSAYIKKVFFLVDRKDLDSQTIQEFNKFEKDSVDVTNKTDVLVKQIKDSSKRLIVTTIQKMANAIKKPQYQSLMENYKNERVVFIIDECHRSQFGDMHKMINKHFSNAQYFGFTGTPRFKENKSQDDRTTADIFGNGNENRACLHHYLIKDAINDGNVLGFFVEYVNTIKGDINEDALQDDEKVNAINIDEVYNDNERLNNIVDHIIKHHDTKTHNRKYCSIFAVSSIPTLIEYYKIFKDKNSDLKIAIIFTFGANEEYEGRDKHSRDELDQSMKDYNQMFKTNFNTDNFSGYFADVCKKMKNAEIDILIVVNMLLTGFDSKLLNTLYVDKNLKYHDLLQAFSRTNRVYDSSKPYGNIVCYRNLKKRTDEAIMLFSNTDNVDVVLMKDKSYYIEKFDKDLEMLRAIAPTPAYVDYIKDESKIREFVYSFRELARDLLHLESFLDFDFDVEVKDIKGQEYQDYKSKYLDLAHSSVVEKTSILKYIDFCTELVHSDKINFEYIMQLMRNIRLDTKENKEKDIEDIMLKMNNVDNEELRLKIELIRQFLLQVAPNLTEESVIDDEFGKFMDNERNEEIEKFANSNQFNEDLLKDMISEYEFSGLISEAKIMDNLNCGLLIKSKKTEQIKNFIIDNVDKYQ